MTAFGPSSARIWGSSSSRDAPRKSCVSGRRSSCSHHLRSARPGCRARSRCRRSPAAAGSACSIRRRRCRRMRLEQTSTGRAPPPVERSTCTGRASSTSACGARRVERQQLALGRLDERVGHLLLERRVERDRLQRRCRHRGTASMIVRASAWRAASASDGRVARDAARVADRLEDRAEVADRDALAQQRAAARAAPRRRRACRARPPRPRRRSASLSASSSLRVSWRVSSSSAWRRIVSVRCVTTTDSRVDDRVAERLGLGARAVLDPDRGQAERRLRRRDAGEARAARRPGSSPGGGRGRCGRARPRRRAP